MENHAVQADDFSRRLFPTTFPPRRLTTFPLALLPRADGSEAARPGRDRRTAARGGREAREGSRTATAGLGGLPSRGGSVIASVARGAPMVISQKRTSGSVGFT